MNNKQLMIDLNNLLLNNNYVINKEKSNKLVTLFDENIKIYESNELYKELLHKIEYYLYKYLKIYGIKIEEPNVTIVYNDELEINIRIKLDKNIQIFKYKKTNNIIVLCSKMNTNYKLAILIENYLNNIIELFNLKEFNKEYYTFKEINIINSSLKFMGNRYGITHYFYYEDNIDTSLTNIYYKNTNKILRHILIGNKELEIYKDLTNLKNETKILRRNYNG